jgi:hypothetical protein
MFASGISARRKVHCPSARLETPQSDFSNDFKLGYSGGNCEPGKGGGLTPPKAALASAPSVLLRERRVRTLRPRSKTEGIAAGALNGTVKNRALEFLHLRLSIEYFS